MWRFSKQISRPKKSNLGIFRSNSVFISGINLVECELTSRNIHNHDNERKPLPTFKTSKSYYHKESFELKSKNVDKHHKDSGKRRFATVYSEENIENNNYNSTPFQNEARSLNGITGIVRNDWTREEVESIYNLPFMELIYQAATVHRMYFNPLEVQQCTLLSIKTGGCTEDCKYCAQSVRYKTFVKPTPQMKVDEVLEAARRAKEAGSTRFCMGAAWRELGGKKNAFRNILKMVEEVNGMGMEVCATLGMLNAEQAQQLKKAGLTAYNHNLDTSREYYPKVISTRSYDERLQTIANVRDAGIKVCCGGILGLGEGHQDRVGLLQTLATLEEHPESVPINALVSVAGTPLGDSIENEDQDNAGAPSIWDMARMIATARILMPRTMVRLSAGRLSFSEAEQSMMFMAGANSIFNGDKLLTTANPEFDVDMQLFEKLGLQGEPAHQEPLDSPHKFTEENFEEIMKKSNHKAEANTQVPSREERIKLVNGVNITQSITNNSSFNRLDF